MATYTDAIQKLYVAYFSRPADPAGLAYWEGVVTAAKGDTSAVSAAFAASTEYQTEYAQVNVSGVITQIYQNLFGVETPDAAGLAYWIEAINNKVFTIDQAVTKIAAGAQGSDKVAYDSKVLVATSFTAAVDTDAEKAGYNGKDANKAAKDFLATIKTAADATAAITPAALDAKVADVVKAGVPFTLTGALTALNAAQAAEAAFLKATDIDSNPATPTDRAALETAAATAAGKLAVAAGYDLVNDSAAVKAAKLGDTQTVQAKNLADDQKLAADATKAIADKADVLAATKSFANAKAANTVAVKVQADAVAKDAFTKATYDNAHPGKGFATLTTIDVKTGLLVLNDGVTETTNPGITAVLNAQKDVVTATGAAGIAGDALVSAARALDLTDYVATDAATVANLKDIGSALGLDGTKIPTGAQIVAKELVLSAAIKAATPGSQAETDAKAAFKLFNDKVNVVITAEAGKNPLADALDIATAKVTADKAAITDLAKLVADLDGANGLVKQLDGLDADIAGAIKNFTDHGFAKPVALSGFDAGTAAADIFIANKAISATTVFGLGKEDKLFIGSDYQLNTGKLTAGNDAVLEIFLKQDGINTVVTMEKAAYGSHSGANDLITITLVGVNMADVHFDSGIVTV